MIGQLSRLVNTMHFLTFGFDHPYYNTRCKCGWSYVDMNSREVDRWAKVHWHWARTGEQLWL